MYLAYFDESGDPGIYNPNPGHKNSEYFIYSNFYLPDNYWKLVYNKHKIFRKKLFLEESINFNRLEFHTREFLQARGTAYQIFGDKIINPSFRRQVILAFCENIGSLGPAKIITTAIPKNKIEQHSTENYAIEFSIRENLTRMWLDIGKNSHFLMIADEGRQAIIQRYCRKLQIYNPINGRDNKLESMLEDCLFKNSKESYFIQIADLVAYLSYLWLNKDHWTKEIKKVVNDQFLEDCFTKLKPILNLKATTQNSKAIVIYPK